MTERSEEAKEHAAERTKIHIEEAAEALVEVLMEKHKTRAGKSVKRRNLYQPIAEQAAKNRRRGGVHAIPTVNNRAVRPVTATFVRTKWPEICLQCADEGHYVVWDRQSCKGVRLGTLQEYLANQPAYEASSRGSADRHNERADIIRKKGVNCGYLTPPLLESAHH
jgi:hypothetical protein